MKEIYKKLWELAKPYYEKGRSYDIPHVEWMMDEADRISKMENLSEDIWGRELRHREQKVQ